MPASSIRASAIRAAGGTGSRAVLEVRSHEVPFILEHGQIVGRLVYEHMLERPQALYGTDLGSNYQAQGLKLSKHFRAAALILAAARSPSRLPRQAALCLRRDSDVPMLELCRPANERRARGTKMKISRWIMSAARRCHAGDIGRFARRRRRRN